MNPQFSFLSSLFITFILLHIPRSSCADDEQYVNCGQLFECGTISDIGYPFWGGIRPSYCGHPGFELNCSTDAPLLTIESRTYRVLAIQNTTRNLTVVREEFWNNTCPTNLYNATLDTTIFDYSSNSQDVTLYYGCQAVNVSGVTQVLPNQFSCGTNISYYATGSVNISNLDDGSSTCDSSVIVRVNQAAADALASVMPLMSIREALNAGFGLQWANDTDCEGCVGSGGRCGYNTNSSSFACYCSDRPHERVCGDSATQTNVPLTIGLALAGAAIAGVGVGWCIFSWRQRKKKRLAAQSDQTKSKDSLIPSSSKGPTTIPSTNFSQSIPSYPSVTLKSSDLEKGSTYFGAQVFSYAELEEATDNFDRSRELGEGGFGAVYYGKLHDGREVAVKRLFENNFKRVEQFMNEVEILTHLRHHNLVKLYGCTSKRSRELLLVYEYISNGTVADHLHGKQSNSGLLSWPVRLSIAVETADALAYLHASDIIHRDVKTNNILLDKDFHVKVADFGLSRLFPTDATHVSTAPQGTPGYVDPEYYQIYQLTSKSDVYSFGVVLIELISSKQAVDTNRHRHDINLANMAINRIQNQTLHELVDPCLEFETNSSVQRMITLVAQLAFRCLQHENQMRPSMEEVQENLRGIQSELLNGQKAEVVDILEDDVGVLEANLPPMSPESVVTEQRGSESTTHSSS